MGIFSKAHTRSYVQHFAQMLVPSTETWSASAEWPQGSTSYLHIAYPSVALSVLTAIIGSLMRLGDGDWNNVFAAAAFAAVNGFVIVHTGVFLTRLTASFFHAEAPSETVTAYAVYAMSPIYAVNLLYPLMTDLFFLKFLYLGCIYSAYTGAFRLQSKGNSTLPAVISGVCLSATPMLVGLIVGKIFPGLHL
ncbi:MAG: hypothetical protein J6Y77_07240 [Paludibacteraceae bacterium]|nr:hypothetical protein [Paludibacteraceae bacterium]